LALFLWRINHIGVIFIPIFLTHFTFLFLGIQDKRKTLIPISYTIGLAFLALNATPLLILNVTPKFSFRYFINPGVLYYPFIGLWVGWAFYGNTMLLKEYFRTTGYRKQQMKYFCWAILFSYIGGVPNFLPTFNIEIPWIMPYGTYAIPFYALVAAYSIIRYRLIDIRLTITKISIFFAVYALVLGVPFLLSYNYQMPNEALWLMLILATAGPYIYTFLRKQAENKLFQEQIAYQKTLKQASYGIGKIKKLDTLVKLIDRILIRSVGIEQCAIYLIDQDEDAPVFNLTKNIDSLPSTITIPTEVLNALKKHNVPFIIEELVYQNQNNSDVKGMVAFLKTFQSEIVIPIVQSDRLLSLILLGKKKDHSIYTNDDLTVFTILASQAGLAIENCLFIEAEKERLQREGASTRRESLDMLVSTMAHEIDNPIQGAIGQAAMLKMCLDFFRDHLPKETMDEVSQYCEKIEFNCLRVSKIVKAVENYSKRETGDLKPITLEDVIIPYHSLVPMIQKKHKSVKYTEDIGKSLPPVWAEEIMIEEILMNLVENAYHAVIHNEGDKTVHLHIFKKDNDYIRINVQDNGYGIASKIKNQLFQVPTTTKGSSEGTGLGLYRIRQICDILKANYGVESKGRGCGALFYVELPIHNKNSQTEGHADGK